MASPEPVAILFLSEDVKRGSHDYNELDLKDFM